MMDDEGGNLIGNDKVEGTAVYGADRTLIGSIDRLMIDKLSGKVVYAVLSFGGFLGLGEKHLPIPWERLKYDPAIGAYAIDITDDELAKAPSYAADKEFDWGDRTRERQLHDYYQARPYWGI